jgi:iron(III) transport system ATP-binding protein
LGRSGEGKTTLAKILGGLDQSFEGELKVQPNSKVILVQQDFVIWPHLTVLKNIEVVRKGSKTQTQADSIERILNSLGIQKWIDEKAGNLSYGQQQRVALARALFFAPELIILDEPFAHYDPEGRRKAWNELITLFKASGMTSLWITHNPEEALSHADHILFLENGHIAHEGIPEDVYGHPASLSIARFCGEITILNCEEQQQLAQLIREKNTQDFKVEDKLMGLRPESLELVEAEDGSIQLTDVESIYLGRG